MVKKKGGREINPADAHRCVFAQHSAAFCVAYLHRLFAAHAPAALLLRPTANCRPLLLCLCSKAERAKEIKRNKQERSLQRAAFKQRCGPGLGRTALLCGLDCLSRVQAPRLSFVDWSLATQPL